MGTDSLGSVPESVPVTTLHWGRWNTVITHRRNIARKLQIHSPAGLTIYAIVNNLVDISSVKL